MPSVGLDFGKEIVFSYAFVLAELDCVDLMHLGSYFFS